MDNLLYFEIVVQVSFMVAPERVIVNNIDFIKRFILHFLNVSKQTMENKIFNESLWGVYKKALKYSYWDF